MINGKSFLDFLEQEGKGDYSWNELAGIYGYLNGAVCRGIWRRHNEAKLMGKSFTPKNNLADKLERSAGAREATAGTYIGELEDMVTRFQEDMQKGEAELDARFASEIRTLEELIAKTRIDTEVWEVTKYVQNYWGNSKTPHWQVKAWLSRKTTNPVDLLTRFFQNYTTNYIPIPAAELTLNPRFSKPVSVLISLADPHIDKVETSGSSIDQKCSQYLAVLDDLIQKSYHSHHVDEIVYVLGNDFFTSDTYWNTTTATTPQAVTNEFDSAYEKGFALAIRAINTLKQFCHKLNVVYVPANHDRTKSFYLVHALSVYFAGDPGIVFDRSADNTKAYQYGATGIFFHHGDTPVASLPLYMATKYRELWGQVRYSEICLGDKHHKKEWKYSLSNTEDNGTRMFICPALTGPDKWHTDKRYDNSIQAGICRIYCKEGGKVAEFESRV